MLAQHIHITRRDQDIETEGAMAVDIQGDIPVHTMVPYLLEGVIAEDILEEMVGEGALLVEEETEGVAEEEAAD